MCGARDGSLSLGPLDFQWDLAFVPTARALPALMYRSVRGTVRRPIAWNAGVRSLAEVVCALGAEPTGGTPVLCFFPATDHVEDLEVIVAYRADCDLVRRARVVADEPCASRSFERFSTRPHERCEKAKAREPRRTRPQRPFQAPRLHCLAVHSRHRGRHGRIGRRDPIVKRPAAASTMKEREEAFASFAEDVPTPDARHARRWPR